MFEVKLEINCNVSVGTFSFELESILDDYPKVVKGDKIFFSSHQSKTSKFPAYVMEVIKAKVTIFVFFKSFDIFLKQVFDLFSGHC
jgi:hypothetical protein